ncbi:MerR family transcriptional regulator [Psychromarinibacter halotolerans]|uniref:MerR family DNA-binding transcriptional regulator n=1 Tax=Psychromarinibacter halotolerans TaxID=1775175 RepID=A0ABV7GUQ0_9RHOB|nr:MerR family DNA-binding transcriptional regulator [Psychromarinibacter halotolerans]MDF0596106.1 MerR family DNA-binding transcriptional regulator [Psychromarinibacter halotolerans]
MTDEVMTIREMCDAYDVTPRTLRFYESKELLAPIRQGSKRLFTRRDRARLKLILRGKKFGFSLEEIRQILDLYESEGGEQAQLQRAHEAAKDRLSEMERQRDELTGTIEELKSEIEWSANVLTSYNQQAAAE